MDNVAPRPLRDRQIALIHGLCRVTGWTMTELARAGDVVHTTVTRFVKPTAKNSLSAETVEKLLRAAAIKITQSMREDPSGRFAQQIQQFVNWAEDNDFPLRRRLGKIESGWASDDPKDELRTIRVVGHVAAGEWREAIEWPMEDQYQLSVPRSPEFAGLPCEGFEVHGPSMNDIYPDGTVLIVVPLIHMGRDPRPGERVIVQRRMPSGLVEATCKEFRIVDEKPWLWPRSSDPRYQQPQALESAGGEEDDTVITGLVIGSYRPETVTR